MSNSMRIVYLKQMDSIMRSLNDEDYIEWWDAEGVPDGEEDWEWLATNEYFYDIVDAYNTIIDAYASRYYNELNDTEINLMRS